MNSDKLKHLISFLVGVGSGSLPLYIPVIAQNFGANFTLIGALGGIHAFTSGISYYYFGRFSDLRAIRKALIAGGLLLLFILGALHYFANSLESLFFVRALIGIAAGLYTGPMIAYSSGTNTENLRANVSKYLAWGALGWGLGQIGIGYGANFLSYNILFALSSIPFLVAFFASLKIQREKILPVHVPFLPIGIIKKNLVIYFSFFIRHMAAHAIWPLFILYIFKLGRNPTLVAAIFGINPVIQFFVMGTIPRLKWSNIALVKIGLVLSTLALFTIFFAPRANYLLISMSIVGFAWSFLFVGVNLYLLERNVEKATVSGLVQSTMSLAMIVGPITGGILSDLFGMREMILIMSVISLFALVAENLLRK